eukprot:TRINITY_DN1683_c0_g1_i1.p2 TRINITY_DN1683_c0_g1~~TRINITY_DN1683_c0_g1_i1.p2  ORF type:complete len:102 (-),score=17.55 TRINITY_DN1683_c0_g1_i1:437-742(-)
MLYSMFSGRWQLEPDEDGRIFIDRNGEYFQDILDYLRDGHLVEPRNERHRKALVREAEYYRLPGLLKHLEVLVHIPMKLAQQKNPRTSVGPGIQRTVASAR